MRWCSRWGGAYLCADTDKILKHALVLVPPGVVQRRRAPPIDWAMLRAEILYEELEHGQQAI